MLKDNHLTEAHLNSGSDLSGKKIFWVTVLNASITLAEIVGGFLSGSLALLSDGIHNFSDTIAIAVSYFANIIGYRPADVKKTSGYKRAEILSGFINSSVLSAISVLLIYEAIQRFQYSERIDGNLMMIVAAIGLAVNFFSVLFLVKDARKNLNIKSSYLHLLSDTISSVGVLVGGVMIRLWNAFWIDPFITVLIALYILKKTWAVIAKTVSILMQSSATLDYERIKKEIENINAIRNVHHIHIWLLMR